MCLLAVFHKVLPEAPLVVAANRDESYARPAQAMTVLNEAPPRIFGGRDLQAGGTWLAVNELGVMAGVTNRPGGRTPGRRSRGELPLAVARHRSADEAAAAFDLHPEEFNSAWMLAADRESCWYIDVTAGWEAKKQRLPPGLHLLENKPYGDGSAKLEHVRELLQGVEALRGEELVGRLQRALGDHSGKGLDAACVHGPEYGTRSSTIIVVPADAPPKIWYTEGPPCTATLKEFQETP
jgi:uncharacterized protein with NRDE domain